MRGTLKGRNATDRLTFMEETLADNPSISPYFIKFVNGTPTVIDIDAFEDERLTANDLKSIDEDGGAILSYLCACQRQTGKSKTKLSQANYANCSPQVALACPITQPTQSHRRMNLLVTINYGNFNDATTPTTHASRTS